jgi:hypothetical protein
MFRIPTRYGTRMFRIPTRYGTGARQWIITVEIHHLTCSHTGPTLLWSSGNRYPSEDANHKEGC